MAGHAYFFGSRGFAHRRAGFLFTAINNFAKIL